ncbi:MAG: hypothetical protein FWD05_13835 [Oscillospiraceae bacterium]|nr:hypothetical protein [Oscillospiraceae bacterium]
MIETYESLLIVPIIIGLIQMIKSSPIFDTDEARRWLPLASIFIGIVLGIGFNLLLYYGDNGTRDVIVQGILFGLTANGAFSWGKQFAMKKEKR